MTATTLPISWGGSPDLEIRIGTLKPRVEFLLAWRLTASRDIIGQAAILLLVTTMMGLIHLHHPMAGSIEVLVGLFSGHVIRSSPDPEKVELE